MMPTRSELGHWWRVAWEFSPWQRAFWLGLLHDTVEDGYLPRGLLRFWPALDAITRREGEDYWRDYLPRVAQNRLAMDVKIADAWDNSRRPNPRPKYSLVVVALMDARSAPESPQEPPSPLGMTGDRPDVSRPSAGTTGDAE